MTDGCNGGVRYNVTPELMASIFRTYPSVKQKHLKCVPAKMTEEEFWKRFFSSHYFHRDKNLTDAKDLFADCGRQDEQGFYKEFLVTFPQHEACLCELIDRVEEGPEHHHPRSTLGSDSPK